MPQPTPQRSGRLSTPARSRRSSDHYAPIIRTRIGKDRQRVKFRAKFVIFAREPPGAVGATNQASTMREMPPRGETVLGKRRKCAGGPKEISHFISSGCDSCSYPVACPTWFVKSAGLVISMDCGHFLTVSALRLAAALAWRRDLQGNRADRGGDLLPDLS